MTTIHTAFKAFRPGVVIPAALATVEVDICPGIGIHLVGLADSAMKETLLRSITALQACGFRIPGKKIVINIAPAIVGKQSTPFDLAIAVGALIESGQIEVPFRTGDLTVTGELGLDGSIRPNGHEKEMLAAAKKEGNVLVGAWMGEDFPAGNRGECGYYGFKTLPELLQFAGECWGRA